MRRNRSIVRCFPLVIAKQIVSYAHLFKLGLLYQEMPNYKQNRYEMFGVNKLIQGWVYVLVTYITFFSLPLLMFVFIVY